MDNRKDRYGSAAWASPEEIYRAGLFRPQGPFLGYHQGRMLRIGGDGPILTLAGAGAGKGRDVLLYNACGFRGLRGVWQHIPRLMMNDPRGELTAVSINNAARFRKPVYCINAFGLHGLPQHRVNPWNLIDKNSRTFHADVKLLVADLIPMPQGKDAFWNLRAREWAEALVKNHVCNNSQRDAITLPAFYDAVNSLTDENGLEHIVEQMLHSPFEDVRRTGAEILYKHDKVEKEFGGYLATMLSYIGFLSDPVTREALSASDFSLEALCKEDCTVAVILPAEYLDVLAPMQRAIFGAGMIYKFRHPSAANVLFLIDEAAQLGAFDALRRGYSYARGMGCRMWSIWQSPSQVTHNFGPSSLSEFMASAQVRQVFGIRDIETAETMSRMLGQQTLRYDDPLAQNAARHQRQQAVEALLSGGDPIAAAIAGAQAAYAQTHQTEQARALLDPAELLKLPENKQILFVSGLGLNPILADRYPYWTRPEMAGTYLPNPYHPPHDRVKVRTRWRTKEARVITERVPSALAHLPQYQSGEWSYIAGYRPEL